MSCVWSFRTFTGRISYSSLEKASSISSMYELLTVSCSLFVVDLDVRKYCCLLQFVCMIFVLAVRDREQAVMQAEQDVMMYEERATQVQQIEVSLPCWLCSHLPT